jgi:surface carbohydrate biosynthesis protein
MKTIVILVDNKRRDLPGAALIAHHLKKIGVRCELEPLGAWRSVLWAHKPDMIIFNHLNAGHLEKYSQELHRRGILTAVLPNEGILYQKEILDFNASRFHNGSHIDHFFCWNDVHADAIKQALQDRNVQTHVIGIPRFDFYFPPLAKQFKAGPRKKVLFCTNFGFSKFHDFSPEAAARFFDRWSDAVPAYRDWKRLVAIDREARVRFFDFLNAAITQTAHEFILRPHPNEDPAPYEQWYKTLDEKIKARVRYDRQGNIPDLIMECDLEIARDTCTTSLESWVAQKPTIDIHLANDPVFHQEFTEKLTTVCTSSEKLPQLIDALLARPEPEQFKEPRKEHLQKWCNTPDGRVCQKFAALLKRIVEKQPAPDFSKFSFGDIRRGLRLKFLKKLDLPCTYEVSLALRHALQPEKCAKKYQGYEKTIKPSDVRIWEEKFTAMGL